MRITRVLLIVGFVAVLAATKLLMTTPAATSPASTGPATGRPRASPAPLKVTTEIVRAGRLAETVMSTGTLLAAESVELQAEVSGKIIAINLVEGAPVRAGQLLVKL